MSSRLNCQCCGKDYKDASQLSRHFITSICEPLQVPTVLSLSASNDKRHGHVDRGIGDDGTMFDVTEQELYENDSANDNENVNVNSDAEDETRDNNKQAATMIYKQSPTMIEHEKYVAEVNNGLKELHTNEHDIDFTLLEQELQSLQSGNLQMCLQAHRRAELKLAILCKTSQVPIGFHDKIIRWAKYDLDGVDRDLLMQRKSLITHLQKRFNDKCEPIKKIVKLSTPQLVPTNQESKKLSNAQQQRRQEADDDLVPPAVQDRVATVIMHEVVQELFQLLNNPNICNDETMYFPGGYPGAPLPPQGGTINEIWTADAYYEAHNELNIQANKHVLITFLGACDKAVTDKHGKLALEPFLFTLGNFYRQYRKQSWFWRIAGYLINQSLSQYKNSANKLKDYHETLEEIMTAFKDLEAGQGMAWVFQHKGKTYPVVLRFCLLLIIGDTVGHDKLCCRFESRSLKSRRMCRYCDILTEEVDNPEASWKYWEQEQIQDLVDDGGKDSLKQLKEYAFKPVKHAFAKLGMFFGNVRRGIHGALPAELLHLLQMGLLIRLLNEFYCVKKLSKEGRSQEQRRTRQANRGDESKADKRQRVRHETAAEGGTDPQMTSKEAGRLYFFNDKKVEEYEQFTKGVGQNLNHQSDRDLPRTFFPTGIIPNLKTMRKGKVTSGKKSGSEIQGMALVNLLMLSSDYGKHMAEEIGTKKRLNWITNLENMMLLEEWMKKEDGYNRSDLPKARTIIISILLKILDSVQRTVGNGWKLIKFHLFVHLCDDIARYGSPENYNSSVPESLHKIFTTSAGRHTQRRPLEFEWQCAIRNRETQMFDRAKYELQKQEFYSQEWIEWEDAEIINSNDEDDFFNNNDEEDSPRVEEEQAEEEQEENLAVERTERLARYRPHDGRFYKPGTELDKCIPKNEIPELYEYTDGTMCEVLDQIASLLDLEYIDLLQLVKKPVSDAVNKKDNSPVHVLYRAHPSRQRMDWCLVDWGRYGLVESQLNMFIDLRNVNVPLRGLSIQGSVIDSSGIYALGHSLRSRLRWDDHIDRSATDPSVLVKKATLDLYEREEKRNKKGKKSKKSGPAFINPQIGHPIPYIWKAEAIHSPLVAIQNFNEYGLKREEEYLFVMPRGMWADHFLKKWEWAKEYKKFRKMRQGDEDDEEETGQETNQETEQEIAVEKDHQGQVTNRVILDLGRKDPEESDDDDDDDRKDPEESDDDDDEENDDDDDDDRRDSEESDDDDERVRGLGNDTTDDSSSDDDDSSDDDE